MQTTDKKKVIYYFLQEIRITLNMKAKCWEGHQTTNVSKVQILPGNYGETLGCTLMLIEFKLSRVISPNHQVLEKCIALQVYHIVNNEESRIHGLC